MADPGALATQAHREPESGAVAYADESMRATSDPPMYLLGATVLRGGSDEAVDGFAGLKRRGERKLHWRDMGRGRQARSLEAIARMPSTTFVVVASPMNPRKPERARRKCLEALLPMLDGAGVASLVMESRNPTLDARDLRLADALNASGRGTRVRISHERGEDNPRLWIPDQVLGAYSDVLCEQDLPGDWVDAWARVEATTSLDVVRL